MDQVPQLANSARVFRIIHAALTVGLVLVGGTFFLLLRVRRWQSLGGAPAIGLVLGALGAGLLVVAATVLRPKVPPRRFDEAPETYWMAMETRAPAIILWCVVQAAGLLGLIGYVLTGRPLAAAAGALALAALVLFRPSRLEGEGAA